MIADLLPLLAFASLVVIARNVFEAHVLEHERRKIEARTVAGTKRHGGRPGTQEHR